MESISLLSSLNSLDSFSKTVSSTYGTFGDDLQIVDMADEEINISKELCHTCSWKLVIGKLTQGDESHVNYFSA